MSGLSWQANEKWGTELVFDGLGYAVAVEAEHIGGYAPSNWTQEAVCAPQVSQSLPGESISGFGSYGIPATLGPHQLSNWGTPKKSIGWGIFTNGIIVVGLSDGWSPTPLVYAASFDAGVYHYIALVAASDVLSLYVDGDLVRSVAAFATIYPGLAFLGKHFYGGGMWQGKIAGLVKISSVALSSAQISANSEYMGFG